MVSWGWGKGGETNGGGRKTPRKPGENFGVRIFASEHVEALNYCIRKIGSIFAFLLDYSCIQSTQCIPSSCKCFKAIKKGIQHPLTLYMKPFKIWIYSWNIYLKQLQLTIFLEHLHVGENINPHFPCKKKRPPSSWWVGLTGDGKAWRWRHHRQVEPTGKRIHLPRLGGWHLWDLVTTFFRGNVWMNIFGFCRGHSWKDPLLAWSESASREWKVHLYRFPI